MESIDFASLIGDDCLGSLVSTARGAAFVESAKPAVTVTSKTNELSAWLGRPFSVFAFESPLAVVSFKGALPGSDGETPERVLSSAPPWLAGTVRSTGSSWTDGEATT